MNFEERPVVFDCDGERLLGILSLPELPRAVGVVIIVGGPQYRVGSHRQFVQLARRLATSGYPTMRFDYRGMGDSEGRERNFDELDDDIRAAIDAFMAQVPEAAAIALWGLCGGASAAAIYLEHTKNDRRVGGVVLVNPWVRSESTAAQARMKHHYLARAMQAGFWKKVAAGKVDIAGAVVGIASTALRAIRRPEASGPGSPQRPFQARMLSGLERFKGRVLLILSGDDLVAQEFADQARRDSAWRQIVSSPSLRRVEFAEADHTFSRETWKRALEDATLTWLNLFESELKSPSPGGIASR